MEAALSCKFRCKRLAGLLAGHRSRRAGRPLACVAERNGRPVVLKLNPRGHRDDAQLAGEGDALAFWSATGAAVELLDQRDDGFTLLLERLQPGDMLETPVLDLEARLAEIGRLVARLRPELADPGRRGSGAHPPRPPRRKRPSNQRRLEGHRPQGSAGRPPRRLELYADAAEMDPAKAREWTRIRAGAEAEEVGDDSAWAGALRRMADALD